ncbi:MAG: DUF1016 N-terminal domain-containing protein [Leptospirales bacterium]|nr:DUF1016 N-terminal domain-containing protein [Leptospirales bacterium]
MVNFDCKGYNISVSAYVEQEGKREVIDITALNAEIERQQREQGRGKSVVEILAQELQKEFPGIKGFSTTNLWRMRSFYLEYSQNSNLPPSVGEIEWSFRRLRLRSATETLVP